MRLVWILLSLLLAAASLLYLEGRYPAVGEVFAEVPAVQAELARVRALATEHLLPPQLLLAAVVGLVGLALALRFVWWIRRRRKRRRRRSGAGCLPGLLFGLGCVVCLFVVFWTWLYLQPHDTLRLGQLRIERGSPEQFVDTSLNVVLLVLAGHFALPLLGLCFARRPKPKVVAAVAEAEEAEDAGTADATPREEHPEEKPDGPA